MLDEPDSERLFQSTDRQFQNSAKNYHDLSDFQNMNYVTCSASIALEGRGGRDDMQKDGGKVAWEKYL